MFSNNTLYGELIKKKKGWPIFFLLLAIAFPILNSLHFHWMNPTYALLIGVAVIILCFARIRRISKNNAMDIVCTDRYVIACNGKNKFVIFYNEITDVETANKKSVKISCEKKARVKATNKKCSKFKAIKKPLCIKNMKNYEEVVAFIGQKMALTKQPVAVETEASEIDSPKVPTSDDAVASPIADSLTLENLIANKNVPVVMALVMNSTENQIPMIGVPVEQPAPKKILPELPAKAPETVYEKLQFNKILWLRGDITTEEKNRRNAIIYREEFPELYGGKPKIKK